MGDDHFAPIHGKGRVALKISSGKTITLFNMLYVPKLRKNLVSGPMSNKCEYRQVYESYKYILSKSGHVLYKRMLEMSKYDLIPAIDENLEKCTTSPYTTQQNGVAKRKNKALKEMVNSMLSYLESRDAIFDENHFFSLPRPKDAIHNLVIHQMDVKTVFFNGDLDEEVYMKQPEGFVMPGDEHTGCKLVKSLYGLKQAPKQWHQKFDVVVLSSGFHLNQSDKCVYSKFDSSGKGVIICLYLDDMLIFGTDHNQVDKTKKFLSSKFSMKYIGEADVILAFTAAGNKAEWLRNLIHEIPIWLKTIASISFHWDSAATFSKSYSQMYNGKSRHL
nr:zinc finger, CCHC-type [Tanacetum cinerariifolium]